MKSFNLIAPAIFYFFFYSEKTVGCWEGEKGNQAVRKIFRGGFLANNGAHQMTDQTAPFSTDFFFFFSFPCTT